MDDSIVLIGMPGSGKSTVGVILARMTSRQLVDTDLLIQKTEGRTLQDIVDDRGYMVLREIEEKILLGLRNTGSVIATGGSAVYSAKAMSHLKSLGTAVFLHVDMSTLLIRVSDYETRGLAKKPGQTFAGLFKERSALYRKYADITIDCRKLTQEEICRKIIGLLAGKKAPIRPRRRQVLFPRNIAVHQ